MSESANPLSYFPEPPRAAIPPPLEVPPSKPLVWPALIVLTGILIIGGMALWETQVQTDQVWRHALLAVSGEPLHDDVYTVRARKVSDENFPPSPFADELRNVEGGAEVIAILGLEMRERVVALELPGDQWQAITASGLPPELGQRQVLAGELCRLDSFSIDGETFTVSGRLQRGTAGMAFAYLLPYDDSVASLFSDDAGATKGWLDPEGQLRDFSDEEIAVLESDQQQLIAPMVPTTMPIAWGGMLGIVLVTIGGAFFQVRALSRLSGVPLFAPIILPMRQFSKLIAGIHVLCYGALMSAALVAFAFPLLNLQVLTFVSEIFTTGELSHLGAAYMSGNVVEAAWFTFWNNYVVQTLVFSVAPSLIIPFWGLFKTMLNLAIAGFALAPLWTDLLARFTYHSITLSLEVEAYVIAAFGVCLYPVYIWRALRSDDAARGLLKIPPMIFGTVLLSGALLFFAAFYEAVTLILIG